MSNKVTALPNTSHAQDLAYTYDVLGNITQIVDNSNLATAKTINYTYDNLSRLLTASTTNAATSPNYKYTYTYDALGNITSGPLGAYSYAGNTGSNYANPDAVTSIASSTAGTSGGTSTSTPTYVQNAVGTAGSVILSSSVTTGNTIVVGLTVWSATTTP